jgi:hypothetical protein
MKIQTILEDLISTKVKDIDLSNKNVNLPLKSKDSTRRVTGSSGYYSHGIEDKDQHLYKKIARSHSRQADDPYWGYVELCIKYQDSNPFFPRIYEFKKYRDKNGNVIPKVKLERLNSFPPFEGNEKLFVAAINNVKGTYEYTEEDVWGSPHLSSIVQNIIEGREYSENEHIIEFSKILKKFMTEQTSYPKVQLDLHLANIMYRTSNHGIQVVITDPFAGVINKT